MTPKLIAIDLDGTLLNSQGRSSQRNAAALRAAHAAGIVLAPATARWYQAAVRPFEGLGIEVPAIASAGADVRAKDGSVVGQWPLETDFALFFADLCNRAGWTATVSTHERAYRRADELPVWAANAPDWLKPVKAFEGEHLERAFSVLAEARADDAYLSELEAWAGRASLHHALSFNGDALLTITGAGVDKGSGLLALCSGLGIAPAEAVALGDSDVDVPMFRIAGTAVVMANGTAAAKAAANMSTASADEDGVAEFIESLL